MKTIRAPIIVLGSLLPLALTANAAPDFSQTVRDFSANRHQLIQDLSSRLNLPLPPAVEPFFQAAMAGDWSVVSNQLAQLKAQDPCQPAIASLMNALWAPIHETWGLYAVWTGLKEDSGLMNMFTGPILASMPAGSIYFGGTDAGRFAITAVNAVQNPPPVVCLTQNALADNSYLAYLRATCGDRIWLPSQEDSQAAFRQYLNDVKEGRIPAGADVKIEDGKVQVEGVAGVMMINSMLSRMIFDHNKDTHPFFVEESYVLGWMYPYLEPHGLILQLCPKPVVELSPETIARDQQLWDEQEKNLFATPGFAQNLEAHKIFAKLRAAIAGVYEYRKLNPEAEAAYRQAIRLCPASPEANFRLANMFAVRQQTGTAIQVMEAYLAVCRPEYADQAREYLVQLRKTRAQAEAAKGETIPPSDPQVMEK